MHFFNRNDGCDVFSLVFTRIVRVKKINLDYDSKNSYHRRFFMSDLLNSFYKYLNYYISHFKKECREWESRKSEKTACFRTHVLL